MGPLVRYEQARVALAECARVDDAKDILDKAAALALYARQRDDRDLEVWVQEIKLRASIRIGELAREIETAERARTDLHPDAGTQTKTAILAEAGLSTSTAHRYEELAGGRQEQAQNAAKAAAETYFARARQEREPATMDGLRSAVKDAIVATVGPREPRAPRAAEPVSVAPIGTDWIDWTSAVKTLANLSADLTAVADRTPPSLRGPLLTEARTASERLSEWLALMEKSHVEAA
ncbi:hypothetical protein [Roseomonas chloroacetimidivorans]|uniref:hypothetical protein n=1 Tax=Roseomonas chloroacetimidivorans TaxID=1766656 RepID=UPI003C785D85